MNVYIAGSAKCSTKTLSQILTSLLSAVKEGLQKYCETAYSQSGVNQMWILKHSKTLLENFESKSLKSVTSIKSYDFVHIIYNYSSFKIKVTS